MPKGGRDGGARVAPRRRLRERAPAPESEKEPPMATLDYDRAACLLSVLNAVCLRRLSDLNHRAQMSLTLVLTTAAFRTAATARLPAISYFSMVPDLFLSIFSTTQLEMGATGIYLLERLSGRETPLRVL